MTLRRLFKSLKPERNTLRGTLALYFIPITVVPVIVISAYATHVFQKNTNRILRERAVSERDAILGEFEARKNQLLEEGRQRAKQGAFLRAVKTGERDVIEYALGTFRQIGRLRVFSPLAVSLLPQEKASRRISITSPRKGWPQSPGRAKWFRAILFRTMAM